MRLVCCMIDGLLRGWIVSELDMDFILSNGEV